MRKIDKIWIMGIGRLGRSLFETWKNEKLNINLVDRDKEKLSCFKNFNIGLIVADVEQLEELEELEIDKNDVFVITIGEDFKSSILICQNLLDLEVDPQNIYVRALDKRHERIINLLKIENTFHPFKETSKNIAFNITQNSSFFFSKDEFNIFSITNEKIKDKKIKDLELDDETKFLLITKKKNNETNVCGGQTVINEGDELIILTKKEKIKEINKKLSR